MENNPNSLSSQPSIVGLGKMIPMKFNHTMGSFWKCYRGNEGYENNFYFLPLRCIIGDYSMTIDKTSYPYNIEIILFPFGACCVNINVDLNNLVDYKKFITIVNNGPRCEIYDGIKKYTDTKSLLKNISSLISNGLFSNPSDNDLILYPKYHLLILLKETDTDLVYEGEREGRFRSHTILLSSLISRSIALSSKSIGLFSSLGTMIDRPGELVLSGKKTTLIYPSAFWINQFEKEKQERILNCMFHNYKSLLSVFFSSKGYIDNHDGIIDEKIKAMLLSSIFELDQSEIMYNDLYGQTLRELSSIYNKNLNTDG